MKNWRLASPRNEEESPDSHEAGAGLWRLLTKASEFAHPYFLPLFWTGTSDVGNYSRSSLLPLQLFQAQNTLNKVQLTGMALVAFLFLVNFRDEK